MLHMAHAQAPRWADKVEAFYSEFVDSKNPTYWRAKQVLGAPNNRPCTDGSKWAWSPAEEDNGSDFITVSFSKPAPAQQVVVIENTKPTGAVQTITLYDTQGNSYKVYSNPLPGPNTIDCDKVLAVVFERTSYDVAQVRVDLNPRSVPGWNHIDAIGLLDSPKPFATEVYLGEAPVLETQVPESLGNVLNSSYAELLPVISTDGSALYFVRSNHPQHQSSNTQGAWVSYLQADGTWGTPELLPEPITNKANSAVLGAMPDGNTLLLNNRYYKDKPSEKGVSITRKTADGWEFPTNLEIRNYENLHQYSETCLAPNGQVMVLTVQRSDPANLGEKDLYVCFLEADGTWSTPKHMGNVVNTTASEASPFIAADGMTMYYSTAGFMGYGNNDMYMTRRLDDTWTNWSRPVNLGPSFNSDNFDAYCTIPAKGDYVYFVRGTKDNLEDIFRAKLPEPLKPNPVVLIKGRVLNAKTKAPMAATIRYEYLANGKDAGQAASALPQGDYRIVLPAGHMYGFRAEAEGFIAINENLEVKALSNYSEINRDLMLVPIEVGQTIRLNNIFFETGKHDLRLESAAELDRLVTILQQNPAITIEISGHTDNMGTPALNQPLSEQRAKSVLSYLQKKGVAADRMVAKGYAATKPVGDNTTAEGRQANRRVEFTILKK